MNDESNTPGGARPGERRRRRRRRRGPGAGAGGGSSAGSGGGELRARESVPPAGTSSSEGAGGAVSPARRRRRRRRPNAGSRPAADNATAGAARARESGDTAAQPGHGERAGHDGDPGRAHARRRRRRRHDGARPAEPAGERPSSTPTASARSARPSVASEASTEAGLAGALEFPDEGDWDLSATPKERHAAAARQRGTVEDSEDGWSGEGGTTPAPTGPSILDVPEPELDPDGDDEFLDLDPAAVPAKGVICNRAQVCLRDRYRLCPVNAGDLNLQPGDQIVVETDQGLSVGQVARRAERAVSEEAPRRALRHVDANDQRQQARNLVREREAFTYCRERIKQRRLPMKLIRVEYLHGGSKAIFYFAAENRVDFRDLVKDLAARLHTRIVMRQVGVRDESRMTGGIGSCGCELCCATWLPHFEPVSIRMAKDQNLVLNPQKVSGQCGRLKCCLAYEQALYHDCRKRLPKLGRRVRTPEGEAKVVDVDILRLMVKVVRDDGSEQVYPADRLQALPPAPNVRDDADRG